MGDSCACSAEARQHASKHLPARTPARTTRLCEQQTRCFLLPTLLHDRPHPLPSGEGKGDWGEAAHRRWATGCMSPARRRCRVQTHGSTPRSSGHPSTTAGRKAGRAVWGVRQRPGTFRGWLERKHGRGREAADQWDRPSTSRSWQEARSRIVRGGQVGDDARRQPQLLPGWDALPCLPATGQHNFSTANPPVNLRAAVGCGRPISPPCSAGT